MLRVGIISRVIIDGLHFEYISHLTIKTIKSLVNGGNNNPWRFFRLRGLRTFQRRSSRIDIYLLLGRIRQHKFIVHYHLQMMAGTSYLLFRIDVVVPLQKLVVPLPEIAVSAYCIPAYFILYFFVHPLQLLVYDELLLPAYFYLGEELDVAQDVAMSSDGGVEVVREEGHQETVGLDIWLVVVEIPRHCPLLPGEGSLQLADHHYYKIISQNHPPIAYIA